MALAANLENDIVCVLVSRLARFAPQRRALFLEESSFPVSMVFVAFLALGCNGRPDRRRASLSS